MIRSWYIIESIFSKGHTAEKASGPFEQQGDGFSFM
jgi:hypothetical protein